MFCLEFGPSGVLTQLDMDLDQPLWVMSCPLDMAHTRSLCLPSQAPV